MYTLLEEQPTPPRTKHSWLFKLFGFLLGVAAALTIFILVYYSILLKSERENTVLLKFEKILEKKNQTNI